MQQQKAKNESFIKSLTGISNQHRKIKQFSVTLYESIPLDYQTRLTCLKLVTVYANSL